MRKRPIFCALLCLPLNKRDGSYIKIHKRSENLEKADLLSQNSFVGLDFQEINPCGQVSVFDAKLVLILSFNGAKGVSEAVVNLDVCDLQITGSKCHCMFSRIGESGDLSLQMNCMG